VQGGATAHAVTMAATGPADIRPTAPTAMASKAITTQRRGIDGILEVPANLSAAPLVKLPLCRN
jgi:hypothetical protein